MAKITEIFNLNKSQYEIDFVNIDPETDTELFIDPYWLSRQENEFAIVCDTLIKSFFTKLISLIKNNEMRQAIALCSHLKESSDICLGYSKKRGTLGSGMGPDIIRDFCYALKRSTAVENDLLVNIEDAKIFLENIDVDRISDMVANIIRKPLLEYTIQQCNNYNIPMTEAHSNFFWEGKTLTWERVNIKQLIVNGKHLLLVPKNIVADSNKYTSLNFLQHYILNALQEQHLQQKSVLVQKRKDGTEYVTKKSIRALLEGENIVLDKGFCEQFAVENPEVFELFKNEIISKYIKNIEKVKQDKLAEIKQNAEILKAELAVLKPGRKDEKKYQDLIFDIINFLLGDKISNPSKEVKIHDGRKRVDILCLNSSTSGILKEIIEIYRLCLTVIMFECKNYSNDISNPEVDQLAGRFSPLRAQCGFLVFRQINDKELLYKRCQDTYRDHRGLIIPLSDEDIIKMLQAIIDGENKFDSIIRAKIMKIVKN